MAKQYKIESRLVEIEPSDTEPLKKGVPLLEIMTPAEAQASPALQELPEAVKRTEDIHFCKAEVHTDYLCGTFLIPRRDAVKNDAGGAAHHNTKEIRFSYAVLKDHVFLIDEGGYVLETVQKLGENLPRGHGGLGFFLADFLDTIISGDLLFLTEIENRIAHMEDEVLCGNIENFNHKIMACRRQIMRYSHYYLQLSEVSNVMQQNDSGFFTQHEIQAFHLFADRVSRLHSEALMLREYCTQLREVYQSQIDIKQNKIMKILTVVTTIFMPLTLLVGWYGMNFKYMPELNWEYGYAVVIGLSAVIVAVCIWVCRKKHFF